MPLIRVLGLSLYGPKAASHRVRLSQFCNGLASYGIILDIQSLLDNDYLELIFTERRASSFTLFRSVARRLICLLNRSCKYDLFLLYAELIPLCPGWIERLLIRRPYVYDFDDAFYLKYRSGRLGVLEPLLGNKIDYLIAGALAVTAGNEYLGAYARRFNRRVIVLPSVVDTQHYKPSVCHSNVNTSQLFTVGWVGSPSTAPYLRILIEPLRVLAQELAIRFVVVGGAPPSIPGVDVRQVPWNEESEVQLIQQFDVGVMPLPDTAWCRGKCAYKLIQYMACSLPVIASPVGTNCQAVPPSCGFLAASTAEWLHAFRLLARCSELRQSMGKAGRVWVKSHYSLNSALPAMAGLINQVASGSSGPAAGLRR